LRVAIGFSSNFDALHGLDAHHRLRQSPVELAIPLNVASEPRHHARGDDLEHAAQRVARVRTLADRVLHLRLGNGLGTREIARACAGAQIVERQPRGKVDCNPADLHDVREDIDSHGAEKLPTHSADCGARGGLTRTRSLENVAKIVTVVLQAPREVRMPGAGASERLDRCGQRRWRHPVEPIGVVAVGDGHRDRRPERLSAPHAGDELDAVRLDLHPTAAPVAALTAREVTVDVLRNER
jgi:hypothetical protein